MSTVPKELREYFDMADVDENNQRGTRQQPASGILQVSVVNSVNEKASRFRAFQQGRADILYQVQSKASGIHCFPHVSIST
jgi:hypothetical protein